MLKDFFNRPLIPFGEEGETPPFSIGNALTVVVYTAVVIGGAYAAVEIVDRMRPETSSVEEPVTTGAAQYPHPAPQQILG